MNSIEGETGVLKTAHIVFVHKPLTDKENCVSVTMCCPQASHIMVFHGTYYFVYQLLLPAKKFHDYHLYLFPKAM